MKIDPNEIRSAQDASAAADSVHGVSSAEHEATKKFWAQCSNTLIAPPEYYELQAKVLRELVLPALGPLRTALDVGCGDGRFTDVLADSVDSVTGIDISPDLIAQAQDRWNRQPTPGRRPSFAVHDAESPLPGGAFDLVACMGVLSTLLDQQPYLALIAQLTQRVGPGAILITKDTVSTGSETVRRGDGYSVRYRRWNSYRQDLEQAGFSLVTEIELARWSTELVNVMCIWRRAAAEHEAQSPAVEAGRALETRKQRRPSDGHSAVESATPTPSGRPRAQESELLVNVIHQLGVLEQRLERIERNQNLSKLLSRLDGLESTLNRVARGLVTNKGRAPIRVLFLIHHATAWPALRGIVDVMREAPDFEPVVISLPHRFPLVNRLGGEQEVHDMLTQQGYRHVRVKDADAAAALDHVKALSPDVVFRQAPWDGDLPPALSAQSLSFARLCYVPYGYMTARIEAHQFDQAYHRLCWRIFCPDEAHRQLFEDHNQFGDLNCRVTGYPKFDYLVAHGAQRGTWPAKLGRPEAFRLIWAPHFSREGDWLKFGAFDRMAGDMLVLAAADPDLEIVLRPHPAMMESMMEAKRGSALGDFREAWQGMPNTTLSTEAEYGGLFAASNALLTDGLSFFSEYQLFDKPLIFFERPDHVGFNRAGARLVDGMYRVNDFVGLLGRLQMLRAGVEDHTVAIARKRIASDLRPFPGEAAQRIVEVIRSELVNL